jgi:hypothetical protein
MMNTFRMIFTLSAMASLSLCNVSAQALSTRPEILGSTVDPANDIIRVDDVSVPAANGQARQMKVGELTNVPGMFNGLLATREPALGNPGTNGFLLSSTTAGVRSWVAPPTGTTNSAVVSAIATNPAPVREATQLPPRRTSPHGGMFSAIRLAMAASRSVQIAVVGDSLGNEPGEYAESFANHIRSLYPGHRLVKRLIVENADANVRNWSETVVQAAAGERHWYFPASNTGVQGVTFFPADCPAPTGDFDAEIKMRVGNWENNNGANVIDWWVGSSPRLTRILAARFIDSRRLQFAYYNSAGTLITLTTNNLGTVAGAVTSTAPADGTDWTLRVRFDVDNGSGGSAVTFAKSIDNGATWTDMTTLTQGSTTGLWTVPPDDIVPAVIGGQVGFALRDTRIYDLKVRHGHGTKIVNRVAIDYASMGSTSNAVTLAGSPTIYLDNYSYPGRNTSDLDRDLLGVKQIATVTATGTVTGSGNATATVTAAGLVGSPLAVSVAVTNGDTAAVWGPKVRSALAATAAVTNLFNVTGFGASVQLERKIPAANDATLAIALATGTATGITSTNSTITTVGNAAHVERLFNDFGVGVMFFHGGINDQWAGDYSGGSRRWVQGVDDIVDAVLARNDDLMPVLIATNPKSSASGLSQMGQDHQTLRSSLMASHARRNQWGFVDVWTAFYDDGRPLTTLITDGTHPSTTAYAEIWNPLLTDAFDAEAAE